jgi:hypothetical protein
VSIASGIPPRYPVMVVVGGVEVTVPIQPNQATSRWDCGLAIVPRAVTQSPDNSGGGQPAAFVKYHSCGLMKP